MLEYLAPVGANLLHWRDIQAVSAGVVSIGDAGALDRLVAMLAALLAWTRSVCYIYKQKRCQRAVLGFSRAPRPRNSACCRAMDEASQSKWASLPNLLTTVRILGSPGLIILAFAGRQYWLGALTAVLILTEWLDGFLARRLRATSALGARLDTIADAIFYSSLLIAIVTLRPTVIGKEAIWIAAAVVSYLLSWLASWLRFNCLPSYHTWAAKGAWLFLAVGTIYLLAGGSPWPFRAAMTYVVLTNLEAICITQILPECRVDVPSFWHARHPGPDSHR